MINRLDALKSMVAANPSDPFARYGLAMAYAGAGQAEEAVEQFRALLADHPEYAAAYFHAGQTLERLGRLDEAREIYRKGIEVTASQGNQHARSELETALALLG